MLKKIISCIISLLLVVSLSLSGFCNVLNNEIFNEENMLKKLDKVNYYEKAYNIVLTDMKDIMEPSGFDSRILDNTFTVDDIKNEVKNIISSIYSNNDYSINTDNFKKIVSENINSSLQEELRELNDTEKKAVNTFISKLANIYEEEIFPYKYVSFIKRYIPKIFSFLNGFIISLYVLSTVLVIILIIIYIKDYILALKSIFICLISSGFIMVLPNILSKIFLKVEYINILNVNVSVLIQQIIKNILCWVQNIGLVCICIGIVLVIVTNYYVYYNKHKNAPKLLNG